MTTTRVIGQSLRGDLDAAIGEVFSGSYSGQVIHLDSHMFAKACEVTRH